MAFMVFLPLVLGEIIAHHIFDFHLSKNSQSERRSLD
jgi:hypothetical protein